VIFYNRYVVACWDEIRDFLALHYKLNTRLDTPFWLQCREDTELSRLDPFLEFYAENGPSGLGRYSLPQRTESNFGLEGWLVMMVGNCVPYRGRHFAAKEERLVWGRRQAEFAMNAQRGFDVRQALACVRDPGGAGTPAASIRPMYLLRCLAGRMRPRPQFLPSPLPDARTGAPEPFDQK
jgi:tryptophan halogenase